MSTKYIEEKRTTEDIFPLQPPFPGRHLASLPQH